ncbi:AAA family ATPase [Sorangium sp. So ce726]|uniref:ATP-binding protein n=1 Tax=Sorangium sp. So ce726 TaxID=3133319 RepID=UPI003F604CDD
MSSSRLPPGTLRFGPYEADERKFELRRRGAVVPVQRQVLEIILFLARSGDRLVTRDELIAGPWRGTVVSDAALDRGIMLARRVLAEGTDENFIVTVRGKGFRFAETVHAVPEPEEAPGLPEATAGLPARALVGREQELACLMRALAAARAGEGAVVVVTGGPGIGKSHLVEAFARQAEASGAQLAWGRAWEGGGAPAFWPWIEVVRSFLSLSRSRPVDEVVRDAAHDLAALLPDLSARLGATPADLEPTAETARTRFRIFDSIARFLMHAAGAWPLVAVIEDVHLADDSSILMLEFLRRAIGASRLLVVATCRDIEIDDRASVQSLLSGSSARLERIELSGLSLPDVHALLQVLAPDDVSSMGAEAIHRATEGHPLLIHELVRAGSARAFEAEGELPALHPLRVPARLGSTVRERFGRLPPSTREVLATAAVIGRDFGWPLVAQVNGLAERDGIAALEPALVGRIVEDVRASPGHYKFTHAVLRDVVYQDLPPTVRADLHARVAACLERQGSHENLVVTQLAHHFSAAVPHIGGEKAIRYGVEAARQARQLFAYELAVEHYRRVLGLLDLTASDAPARHAALRGLAEVQALSAQPTQALGTFNQLMRACLAALDHEGFAAAVLGAFELVRDVAIVQPEFHAQVREALECVPGDGPLRARLLAVQAFISYFTESVETRLSMAERAIAMARRCEDERTLQDVLRFSHLSDFQPEHCRKAIERAEEMVALAQRLGDPLARLDGKLWLAAHSLQLGEGGRFAREAAEHAQLAARLRHPVHLWHVGLLRCTSLFQEGRLSEAEALLRARFDLGVTAVGQTAAEWRFGGHLITLAWHMSVDERRSRMQEVQAIFERILTEVPTFVVGKLAWMCARFELGQREQVRRDLEGVTRDLRHFPEDAHLLLCFVFLTELAVALGNVDCARAVYDRLHPHGDGHVSVSSLYWGPVAFHLGRLAEVGGDHPRAREHYDHALVESERAESRPWQLQVQRAHARLLSKSPAKDDLDRDARGLRSAGDDRGGLVLPFPRQGKGKRR